MGISLLGVPYRVGYNVHVRSWVPCGAGYMWGVVFKGYPMEQGTFGE